MSTAIILPVYNMGEAADDLVRFIRERVRESCDLYVIDNGSYMDIPATATHRLEENRGAGGGWLYGIERAREVDRYEYYWLLTTSAAFDIPNIHGDPLDSLLRHFDDAPHCVAVQPGWKNTTRWTHKMQQWDRTCYQTPLMNPAAVWNATWWNGVGGFDPRLTYGCGSDMDLSYKARMDDKTFWVCADVPMILHEGIIYDLERSHMSLKEYLHSANRQMVEVLSDKYGEHWKEILLDGIEHPDWSPEYA
jgi:GT2 family glycosyltransferase